MTRVLRIGLVLFASSQSCVQAQQLPVTQVWLAEIEAGVPQPPELISDTDRYNNQPLFAPDGRHLYFTAEQPDGQTDIAEFEIATGNLRTLAHSPESEYSPTPIPGQAAVSVIRVEPDGRQRLWRIEIASGTASLLLPNVEPVGYHTWYTDNAVAMFILGESFTLQKAAVGDRPAELAFDNIGRTLRRHPHTGQVMFVDKNTQPWRIRAIDMETGQNEAVMALLPGHEDFEADSEARYWMGSGSKLYRSDSANRQWRLAADLSEYGIRNITRLGISPDGTTLAIVSGP